MKWLITGGAGFIGSAFTRLALARSWADEVLVVDALTYAGNLANLRSVEKDSRYGFLKADICDRGVLESQLPSDIDAVFHFAAESHVDRSIEDASSFIRTNVMGTQCLLDWSLQHGVQRFVHVSTDEVYGSLELDTSERFSESSPLEPTSPYAASKTASDHLALATHRTHGLDVVVTRCSNNYGPYQFPEKFIPLFITNAIEGKPLPLYGDGLNVRDWIHVDDHAQGIYQAWERGQPGEVYNLGGECERANKDIAEAIVESVGNGDSQIEYVTDRKAHDRRYAIDASKAKEKLDFEPGAPIEERMPEVVSWYRENTEWWSEIKSGEYREYYARMYGDRG